MTNSPYSQTKAPGPVVKSSKNGLAQPLAGSLGEKTLDTKPDYKLDLSESSRVSGSPSLPSVSPTVVPSVPSLPLPDVKPVEIMKERFNEEVKDKIKEKASEKLYEVQGPRALQGTVKKPLVVFIKGLDLFSHPLKSEGGYAGVGRMADSIPGAKIFAYDQKSQIKEEINKIHRDYPVVVVGHSLGADTAVEVANEYDSLKGGFRPIDLLVTMDAIGFNNDIIPQNVKNHLNVFGETSWFLNDGPHVARRDEKTQVRNILSPLGHTEIDDDREIQFEIIDLIKKTTSSPLSKDD
jgi:hypothetical protein